MEGISMMRKENWSLGYVFQFRSRLAIIAREYHLRTGNSFFPFSRHKFEKKKKKKRNLNYKEARHNYNVIIIMDGLNHFSAGS
jgi:hypothetical protein